MYPVMLDVRSRRCLVVGGGKVALRKVKGLLDEGADVHVVAQGVEPELQSLAATGRIRLDVRAYRPSDLEGAVLVFVATDDRATNRRVSEDARRSRLWVNVADDPEFCTFHLPARVKRGHLQLALASNGVAPFLVRRLRQYFDARMGSVWAEWVQAAGRFRDRVLDVDLSQDARDRRFDAFFRHTFDATRFDVRVPGGGEMAALLRDSGNGRASSAFGPGASSVSQTVTLSPAQDRSGDARPGGGEGFVSLVGAGPGDPELLTLKARRRLEEADVIVYDRLAEPAMPGDLSRDVTLIPVGKRPGYHAMPQEAINALLVDLGRQGQRVVRFKGGDPFVFGRGGEEAEALVAAGIRFEVVPGPTSGVAAAAYAGIPVTHREEAVRLTLLTAHESSKRKTQIRWESIARDPHATLVGYMGVSRLPDVVSHLLASGLPGDTPAAIIERGTTPAQRSLRCPVQALPDEAIRAGIHPPALFVIGATVARADRLEWFGNRPLHGERIVVGAPASDVRALLEREGASVVPVRVPLTAAGRVSLAALPVTGVLLTSVQEVEVFHDCLSRIGVATRVVAWCSTPAIRDVAGRHTWRRVVLLDGAGGHLGHALRDSLLATHGAGSVAGRPDR